MRFGAYVLLLVFDRIGRPELELFKLTIRDELSGLLRVEARCFRFQCVCTHGVGQLFILSAHSNPAFQWWQFSMVARGTISESRPAQGFIHLMVPYKFGAYGTRALPISRCASLGLAFERIFHFVRDSRPKVLLPIKRVMRRFPPILVIGMLGSRGRDRAIARFRIHDRQSICQIGPHDYLISRG